MADLLNYLMLLLNMLVVVLIVYKSIKYPTAPDEEAAGNATEAAEAEATTFEFDVLALLLVILPIISGVLLTINSECSNGLLAPFVAATLLTETVAANSRFVRSVRHSQFRTRTRRQAEGASQGQ